MSKKSLLTLLSITCVLVVSFIIYTICAAFIGVSRNETYTQALVLRVDDVFAYTNASYSKPTNEEDSIIKVNEEGKYVAANQGEIVATVVDGNKTYIYNITVVNKGEGTIEDPRLIVSEQHLKELAVEDNVLNYALYNDIQVSGVWETIPNFKGTLTSFGDKTYTISGVRIFVDATKAEAMKSESRVNVGFFGQLAVGAVVKNVNFENVSVEVSTDITADTTNTILSVGALAGYANGATIENVSISSNIAAHATPRNGAAELNDNLAGVGGFVGAVNDCAFNNVAANVTFSIVKAGVISDSVISYVTYGGIFGISQSTSATEVANAVVDMRITNADTRAYRVGGIAGVAEIGTTIKDSVVRSLNCVVSDKTTSTEFAREIAGIVNIARNANINNCHVENANVQGIVYFAGVVNSNAGSTVMDSSFAGTVTGAWYAFGYIGYNGGNVIITDKFAKEYMVNATITAYKAVAGLSYQVGYIDKVDDVVTEHAGSYTSTATNHALVNVNLQMLRPNYKSTFVRYDWLVNNASAGLAVNVVAGSSISNIDVEGSITSNCSVGGVVANLNNGSLKHINVNLKMATGMDAYYVGGIAARVLNKGVLEDIKVNSSLNEGKVETDKVAGTYVGGLVGNIGFTSDANKEVDVVIKDCAVNMNMYVNSSVDRESVEGKTMQKQFMGGLVGALAGLKINVEDNEGAANITYTTSYVKLTKGLVFENVSYVGTMKTDINNIVIKEGDDQTSEIGASVVIGKMIGFSAVENGTIDFTNATAEANIEITYKDNIETTTSEKIALVNHKEGVVVLPE